MRRTLAALLIAAAAVPFVGCRNDDPGWPATPGPKVVASFAPIQSLCLAVAGPDASVRAVMTNQGPHHFDPSLSEVKWVSQADLLFANGLDLDTKQCEKIVAATRNPKLKLVQLGALVPPDKLVEGGECPGGHGEAGHTHAIDPHVWLGLDFAATYVGGIRDELKAVDPAHAAGYDARAAATKQRLTALKADGVAKFAKVPQKGFVSFHGSLNYFAQTFGLEVVAVIQTVPGREPATRELEQLVAACKHHKVKVIAVEPQYSGKTAAARLVEQLKHDGVEGVRLVEIDPLETANPADLSADWYEAKMRANIDALAAALTP